MSSASQQIAFFGSTGGCANACLTYTLNNGYKATALARTPAKLTSLLRDQGVSQEILDNNLTIVQGNVTDVEAVKRTLAPNNTLVSSIVLGIGASPQLQLSLFRPVTLDQPNVCEDATNTILTALSDLFAENPVFASQPKPLVTFISTTGVSKTEDVPFWFRILYHYFLAVPHVDKKNMEQLFVQHMAQADPSKRFLRGIVGVRPSLLTGTNSISDARGLQAVREGVESAPAIGYTVKRADVGHWIFEHVIKGNGQGRAGEMVTLTY